MMRLCLAGEHSPPDEARRVMAQHLLSVLSRECEVEFFDLKRLTSSDQWARLKAFNPDVVHYIPGASPVSFLITKVLRARSNAKTVMFSALNPFMGLSYGFHSAVYSLSKPLVPHIKADLVLVQSDYAEVTYRRLGCTVKSLVYSGVDLQRFRPAPQGQKEELRKKYDVEPDKFVVLHVGSVRKWRNVSCLTEIQKERDNQVILVGRASTKYEEDLASA